MGRDIGQHSQLFGRDLLVTEDPGDVHTDIYGLETCVATFKCPQDRFDLVPPMFSAHPIFTYLNMERRRLSITPGFLIITGEYAGIPGGSTTPIYELSLGVADEPIETNPNFTSFAGSPSNPLNGAYFIDPSTGLQTDNDSIGEFDHFTTYVGNNLNQFAGISSYFAADQLTWRERYCSTARPTDASTVGHISQPAGPAPTPPSGGNWLYIGLNYEQRGNCFFITREWRASGRRRWNSVIYS